MRWRKSPRVSRTVRERYEFRARARTPGRLHWMVVPDSEMLPILHAGVRIAVERECMPDVGDLFVYREADCLRVRRCLDIRLNPQGEREYCQKSDAALHGSWIPETMVVGTVRYIPRGDRYVDVRHWRWRRLALKHLRLHQKARRVHVPGDAGRRWFLALIRRLLHWRAIYLLRRSRAVPASLLTEVEGEIPHPREEPSR